MRPITKTSYFLIVSVLLTTLGSLAIAQSPYTADWSEVSTLVGGINGTWSGHPTDLEGGGSNTKYQGYTAAPILGNGCAGVVLSSDDSSQSYNFTRNDFFLNRSGAGAIGNLKLTKLSGNSGSGSVSYTQDILNAEVRSTVVIGGTPLETTTWILSSESAPEDLMVTTIKHNASGDVRLRIAATVMTAQPYNGDPTENAKGQSGNAAWAYVGEFPSSYPAIFADDATHQPRAAFATRVLDASNVSLGNGQVDFTIPQGTTVTVVTSLKGALGRNAGMPTLVELRDEAVARVNGLNTSTINNLKNTHREWWKTYWLKSYVDTGDTNLNKFYYGALYTIACASRGKNAPPGLWGPFLPTFKPVQWSGGIYCNYNWESTYYGIHTANRSEVAEPYNNAIVSCAYPDRQRVAANNGYDGVTFPRVLSAYGHGQNADQAPYFYSAPSFSAVGYTAPKDYECRWQIWQKTEGGDTFIQNYDKMDTELRITAWLAANMIDEYKKTGEIRDDVYGFLKDAAAFYVDYLDNRVDPGTGKYVMEDSAVNEQSLKNFNYTTNIYNSGRNRPYSDGIKNDLWPGTYESMTAPSVANWTPSDTLVPVTIMDKNSLSDIALIKHLMINLKEISEDKGQDANLRATWMDIYNNISDLPRGNFPDTMGNSLDCFKEAEVPVLNPGDIANGLFTGGIIAPFYPAALCSEENGLNQIARNTLTAMHAKWDSFTFHFGGQPENNFCQIWPAAARVKYPNVYADFKAVVDAKLRTNLTIFQEGGGIETCGAMDTIHEMMMQSHAGYIELFPSAPNNKAMSFKRLAADGAFLVSAEQDNTGTVTSFEIYSRKGNACIVKTPWQGQPFKVIDSHGGLAQTTLNNGKYSFMTTAGETYTITPNQPTGNLAPTASLVVNVPNGYKPLAVTFTLQGYDPENGSLTYKWDYDSDGSIDAQGGTTYTTTYNVAGTYTVTGYVSDGTSESSASTTVTVFEPTTVDDMHLWYKFDETGGTTVNDSSTSGGGNGIAKNGASLGQSDAISGRSAYFDGIDDHILIGAEQASSSHHMTLANSSLTFAAWVKPQDMFTSDAHKWNAILGGWGNNAGFGMKTELLVFSRIKEWDFGWGPKVNENEWQHIAVTLDRSKTTNNLNYYLNGVKLTTLDFDQTFASDRPTFYVGQYAAGSSSGVRGQYKGYIDELKVFKRALSDAEIALLSTVPGSTNVPPVAAVMASPLEGTAPLTVHLQDAGSSDVDGFITKYSWDFDTSNGITEEATGRNPLPQVYSNPGTYTARLTVTDDQGDSDYSEVTITVRNNGNVLPVANVTASPQNGVSPMVVTFSGSTSSDTDGFIQSYSWDFDTSDGIGVDATGASPAAYTYATPGTYTARLTVTDDQGGTDYAEITIQVNQPAPLPDPVIYYNFNEASGTVANDQTGNGYHGDYAAGVPRTAGVTATAGDLALNYPSTPNGLEVRNALAVGTRIANNSHEVTVSLWLKDQGLSWNRIFRLCTQADADVGMLAGYRDSSKNQIDWRMALSTSVQHSTQVNNFTPAAGWSHWAFVCDSNKNMTVYINGVSQGSSTSAHAMPAIERIVIGENCQVEIDEFRLYDVALDTPQVGRVMQLTGGGTINQPPIARATSTATGAMVMPATVTFSDNGSSDADGTIAKYEWDFDTSDGISVDATGTNPPAHTYSSPGAYTVQLTVTDDQGATGTTNLTVTVVSGNTAPTAVSWWKLDETSGTTAADSIGNLDGTLYGNVAWTTAGKYDGGVNGFNAGTDYIDCGAMAGSQDDITVSFWVKATEMKYMFALDKLFDGDLSNDATVNGWAFRFKPGGEIVFQLGTASAVQQNVLAPAGSYAVGTWVHVAGSYNSTTRDAKIYINGSLAKLRSYTNEKPGNTTIPLRIGGTNDGEGNNRFRGTIDDVRIFDHELTATEIVDVMNDSGATVTPAGYDTWKSSITAGLDGRTDDADGDGIANLVEYALGLNPNAVDTTGRPTYTLNNNVVDYAFNALRTELTYEVEISNDLTIPTGWRTHGTASKGSGSLRTVNVPLTEMGTSGKLFLRLKVTE